MLRTLRSWWADTGSVFFTPLLGLAGLVIAAFSVSGTSGAVLLLCMGAVVFVTVAVLAPKILGNGIAEMLVPLVIFGFTWLWGPNEIQSTEFYKAASQILPVLLLAYLVEKRQEFHADKGFTVRLSIVLAILYISIAGGFTLTVLTSDDAKMGHFSVVLAGLIAPVVGLVLSMLTPPTADAVGDSETGAE